MEVVYWDLETTGLDAENKHVDIEILEIGAISETTGSTFKQYILPTAPIPRDASKVHGIFLKKLRGRGARGFDMTSLYFKEDGSLAKVDAVDKRTGLRMFYEWLKGFGKPILLAGYNNHNFDDWVLSHNLLQVDLDVSGLGVRFGDVAKVVRPLLNKEFNTKKWKLGFAVASLLERDQTLAHGALSDAEDARDLLMKLADKQQVTTREILESTLEEKDDRKRALKEFDEVMKVCVKMFLSSGAGMARFDNRDSGFREKKLKEKWKKFSDKKKKVQEEQTVARKKSLKEQTTPEKMNPAKKGLERKNSHTQAKTLMEKRTEITKSTSENADQSKQLSTSESSTSPKSTIQSSKEKLHDNCLGAILPDLQKGLSSNLPNKLPASSAQVKYQQSKLSFKPVHKASLTKTTKASLISLSKQPQLKIPDTQNLQNEILPRKKFSPVLPQITPESVKQHASYDKEQVAIFEKKVFQNLDKQSIPDLECSIPLDEWDQSIHWDQSFQDDQNKDKSLLKDGKENYDSLTPLDKDKSKNIMMDNILDQNSKSLSKENANVKVAGNAKTFIFKKKNCPLKNISNLNNTAHVDIAEKTFGQGVKLLEVIPSESLVVSKVTSEFNEISLRDNKNNDGDVSSDFGSDYDENDETFGSDLSDTVDEITKKKIMLYNKIFK